MYCGQKKTGSALWELRPLVVMGAPLFQGLTLALGVVVRYPASPCTDILVLFVAALFFAFPPFCAIRLLGKEGGPVESKCCVMFAVPPKVTRKG